MHLINSLSFKSTSVSLSYSKYKQSLQNLLKIEKIRLYLEILMKYCEKLEPGVDDVGSALIEKEKLLKKSLQYINSDSSEVIGIFRLVS